MVVMGQKKPTAVTAAGGKEITTRFYHAAQLLKSGGVVILRTVCMDSQISPKESVTMMWPKKISEWCMWLFFLLYGIFAFVPFAQSAWILGILALAYAVLFVFKM